MKILFTWELGSSQETLWSMGRLALALKKILPGCRIAIACLNSVDRALVPWADKVFSSSKIAFRHQLQSSGVSHQLNHLGWTTQELRAMHLQTWNSAFERIKPDVTFAFEAPGSVIVGTMLGYRVLLATARLPDDYSILEIDFPELTDWVRNFSGNGLPQILNRPGISFLSSVFDVGRSSMVLSARLFDPSNANEPDTVVVFPESLSRPEGLISRLNDRGLRVIALNSPKELFCSDVARHGGVKLVIGSYDAFSATYALNVGAPYLGVPGDDRDSRHIAASLEKANRGFRLDTEGVMLDIVLSGLDSFSSRSMELLELDGGGVCSVETACEFFVNKKSPH